MTNIVFSDQEKKKLFE
uniref:Uncharacterized protein n=1 Tax=Anguilla anguilla TaxID=7936 RepID=A0A0E9PHP6_ANGAN